MFRNFLSPGSIELVNSVVTSGWQFDDFNSIHLQGMANIFQIIMARRFRGSTWMF